VKLPTTPLPLQRIETIDVPRDVRKAEANQEGLPFKEIRKLSSAESTTATTFAIGSSGATTNS
jgi:hypothetical protein